MSDLDKKVRDATHRIEELYYETKGKCYVSFSGGKDSTVLLALIKLCEDVYTIPEGGIPAVFSNTGIELGITTDFVKWVKDNYYSNIEIVKPKVSFDWVINEKGKPIRSKLKSYQLYRWREHERTEALKGLMLDGITLKGNRTRTTKIADKDMHFLHDGFPIRPSANCCDYLKKRPFVQYEKEHGILGAMTGVRMSEGGARKMSIEKRIESNNKICTFNKHGIIYKLPIVDWTDKDIDEFIKTYNVPLSDAYTKYGFDRTGCMACPYAKTVNRDLQYLHDHEPNRYKATMHWLKDVYIAQNVVLPFDEAYERERERVADQIRANAAGDVEEIQTKQQIDKRPYSTEYLWRGDMKYKPFNYCAVCGRSMDGEIPYYPYGFTEVPYCEQCAKQIIRSKDQRRKNARKSEADIRRRRNAGEAIEQIGRSYDVSETFIRNLIKGES